MIKGDSQAVQNEFKRWMKKALYTERRIEKLLELKERYQDIYARVTGTMSMPRVSGSSKRDGLADGALALIDTNRELDRQMRELAVQVNERRAMIARLKDVRMQALLEMRYLNGLGWEDIARALHYELRTIHYLHGRALNEVGEIAMEGGALALCGH